MEMMKWPGVPGTGGEDPAPEGLLWHVYIYVQKGLILLGFLRNYLISG